MFVPGIVKKKNIFILPEYWDHDFIGACGWIRLLNPLLNPEISDDFNLEYGYSLKYSTINPDIVIFERLWHPIEPDVAQFIRLLSFLKMQKIKIIYSIDDNLIDYPIYQNSDWYSTRHLSVINAFMHFADVVVVSTPELKVRFSSFHKNIEVISNSIDHRQIKQKTKIGKRNIKFGYLISPDNQEYLFSILEPLRTVLSRYRNQTEFEIAGPHNSRLTKDLFNSLPVTFIKPPDTSFNNYIHWITNNLNWDFGIAPLIKNDFTKCKSDMKFLDFTRMGIPGIYADFAPYEQVKSNNAGFLVDDNWCEAISMMIEDHEKRAKFFISAKEYVSQYRNSEIQISQWKRILNNL